MFQTIKNDGSGGFNINAIHYIGDNITDGWLTRLYIGVSKDRDYDDIIELQMVKGSENLPYEPYIEPITTNIFLSEPLRKIGDYADYVDGKGGKVVRNIREFVVLSTMELLN